ncbi:MAG: diaminopimelate dehydrogenase [Halanaerobiaceae bacterium]
MKKIKTGIVGYGNLGKGVKAALKENDDLILEAIFTRRPPESLQVEGDYFNVEHVSAAEDYIDKIDVMFLCGGSATDLPQQGPEFAQMFNTIDSYDNHEQIPEYFENINEAALKGDNTSVISIGWDPGLFSLNRLLGEVVLPTGKGYTFWGPGVSQGHSDALRRIEGVKDAVQYTIPIEEAIDKVREGSQPELKTREKHVRKCFVVLEDGADRDKIVKEIKEMPNYFADYDTEVNFVSQKELAKEHSAMPHGGFVLRSARTGENENNQVIEFSLKLESNPEFTAQVLVAYGRGVYRLNQDGKYGAQTIYDIPPAYLSPKSGVELRKELL